MSTELAHSLPAQRCPLSASLWGRWGRFGKVRQIVRQKVRQITWTVPYILISREILLKSIKMVESIKLTDEKKTACGSIWATWTTHTELSHMWLTFWATRWILSSASCNPQWRFDNTFTMKFIGHIDCVTIAVHIFSIQPFSTMT